MDDIAFTDLIALVSYYTHVVRIIPTFKLVTVSRINLEFVSTRAVLYSVKIIRDG